jgi:hypothetical protein
MLRVAISPRSRNGTEVSFPRSVIFRSPRILELLFECPQKLGVVCATCLDKALLVSTVLITSDLKRARCVFSVDDEESSITGHFIIGHDYDRCAIRLIQDNAGFCFCDLVNGDAISGAAPCRHHKSETTVDHKTRGRQETVTAFLFVNSLTGREVCDQKLGSWLLALYGVDRTFNIFDNRSYLQILAKPKRDHANCVIFGLLLDRLTIVGNSERLSATADQR